MTDLNPILRFFTAQSLESALRSLLKIDDSYYDEARLLLAPILTILFTLIDIRINSNEQ